MAGRDGDYDKRESVGLHMLSAVAAALLQRGECSSFVFVFRF
jgi:hypothetical protein